MLLCACLSITSLCAAESQQRKDAGLDADQHGERCSLVYIVLYNLQFKVKEKIQLHSKGIGEDSTEVNGLGKWIYDYSTPQSILWTILDGTAVRLE